MSDREERHPFATAELVWLVLSLAAVGAAGLWLREQSVPYLWTLILATIASAIASWRLPRRGKKWRASAWGFVASVAAFTVLAARTEQNVVAQARDPTALDRALTRSGVSQLHASIDASVTALRRLADSAVALTGDSTTTFVALRELVGSGTRQGERSVVLWDEGSAVAWAGVSRIPVERLLGAGGVEFTTFYSAIYVAAARGSRRAVAVELLHADPPADALGQALDHLVADRVGLRGFELVRGPRDRDGWTTIPVLTDSLAVRANARSPGESRQLVHDAAALWGATWIGLALITFLVTTWRRPAGLTERLVSLVVVLAAIAVVPLSSFSNLTRVFDAGVYFAPFGGPFTASAGALSLTSATALAGFFAIQRSRRRLATRRLSMLVVLVIAALGPFLLRDLSRGISPPPRGVTTSLWLSWQVALFLAGSALLLAGVSAGRIALGTRRGISPAIGATLAALAALLGPLLWEVPGSWPGWYPIPWVLAMGALALSRRSKAVVVSAAIVAACGATTLVWGATARKRVELAERDVQRLSSVDSVALQLLERFANDLRIRTPPVEREELLQRYVRSDLAAGGYPVELSSWLPGSTQPYASLQIANFEHRREGERDLVSDARTSGRPVVRRDSTTYGIQLMLAVPHDDESVTTVIVAPRTLLIPNDPYMSLLGLGVGEDPEPPYEVTLTALDAPSALPASPRWQRKGNELHGDATVPAASRPARVHLEVDLRGLDTLIPRGVLIVLLDLLILSVLWILTVTADGGVRRWLQHRVAAFTRSYRARLTVTLFSFFVLPATVFGGWSYLRLQTNDRQSRELLVRETLRSISATGDPLVLAYESGRLRTPLFLYADGTLRGVSDPLYDRLSPIGRYLPPSVARLFAAEDEVNASERVAVGSRTTLFGYRAVLGLGEARGAVLAAPARVTEEVLDRQRRDLGMLVLFAVALGAMAALWLSGLAARELERPIGALRFAALEIARGRRHPDMPVTPPAEFIPVFTAFRRMDDDLAASREALEAAQRQTEAVLRNVASGVIAVSRDVRVVLANPRAEELLGRTLPSGIEVDAAAIPALTNQVRHFMANAHDDESFDVEFRGRQLRANLTRLTRGAGGAVLTLDDVTEVARAQRVLAWGEMARQVAHEIKNPLTPIRLGVQHLRRARLDRRVDFERIFEQNVTRILAEIDRLDEIARAFSRYGMAPADRSPARPVDVAAIVRDVVELERMGESVVSWEVAGATVPVLVQATDDELREVLLNVFENARQAQATRVDVQISSGEDGVHVDIRDNGVGMPEDVLRRIFEPHFSTRTSGSGLGLAISRGLVRGWGGEMTVQSTVGAGTVMRLTLLGASSG
ncbi:MAG: ATP-binding protein [Gemmatimonadaceae bacterium]